MAEVSMREIERHRAKHERKMKKHVSIKESENGGYTVRHHHEDGKHHVFKNHHELHRHLRKLFHGQDEEEPDSGVLEGKE